MDGCFEDLIDVVGVDSRDGRKKFGTGGDFGEDKRLEFGEIEKWELFGEGIYPYL